MNHHIPLNTRRPKTVQTIPKVTARPLWEEFSEAGLGFDEGVEEGNEDDEEVDDDDDNCMSFASRTVYLHRKKKIKSAKAGKC